MADCEGVDIPERTCAGCGVVIKPGRRERNKKKWCSEACRVRTYRYRTPSYRERQARLQAEKHRENYVPVAHRVECHICGNEFSSSRPRKYCTRECSWIADYRRRRARRAAVDRDAYTLREIAERDSWVCRLCGEPVEGDRRWPDGLSGSIDHVTPLSRGGDDTRRNVQLAHLMCNWKKGAGRAPAEGAETEGLAHPKREVLSWLDADQHQSLLTEGLASPRIL